MDVTDQALKERICDQTNRIPTSRWPLFSMTLDAANSPIGEIAAGNTTGTGSFEAERDTLLTDLSISVTDDAGAALAADVTIEYCNVTYALHTDVAEWAYCCQRKPIFLVGVKENKRLKFTIVLAAVAPAGGANVAVTVSGFQGDGCCN